MKRRRLSVDVEDTSFAKLGPFEVGQIVALDAVGYSHREISEVAVKEDGSAIPFGSVGRALRKRAADSTWTGQREEGSGRLRDTTPAQDKAITKEVLAHCGETKMTAPKVRARLGLKAKSIRLIQRRLREAELKWLRRRRKSLVPKAELVPRKRWALWAKRQKDALFRRIVYTDGITFYLDQGAAAVESGTRAALGTFVWRYADHKDALSKDCIGPSRYSKSQGSPVRVWGLLVRGRLTSPYSTKALI